MSNTNCTGHPLRPGQAGSVNRRSDGGRSRVGHHNADPRPALRTVRQHCGQVTGDAAGNPEALGHQPLEVPERRRAGISLDRLLVAGDSLAPQQTHDTRNNVERWDAFEILLVGFSESPETVRLFLYSLDVETGHARPREHNGQPLPG